MIYKCRFCDFSRKAEMSLDGLKGYAKLGEDSPIEDIALWMERAHGPADNWFGALNGVKVHMGRMHKEETEYGLMPEMKLEDHERAILEAKV